MWDGLRPSTFFFLTFASSCSEGLKVVNLIELASLCRYKGGRFMSFREAFGLVLLSSSPCLLFLTAVYVMGLEIIYMSLQVW